MTRQRFRWKTTQSYCRRKTPLSREAAEWALARWIAEGAAPGSVNVYPCNDHYHVGHRPGSHRRV